MKDINTISYEELLKLDIDYFFTNQNMRSLLKRAQINTLEDLISYNTFDLQSIRNMGKKRFTEIILLVHSLGLCFQNEKYPSILEDKNIEINEETLKDDFSFLAGIERNRDSEKPKKLIRQITSKK